MRIFLDDVKIMAWLLGLLWERYGKDTGTQYITSVAPYRVAGAI